MKIFKSLVMAFSMYSVIPMPKISIEDDDLAYVFCFFPLVGLIISLPIYFLFDTFIGFNNTFIAAFFVFLPIILTGGIHIDGFADTCDGYFSYCDIPRRLEILKDPHMGAFGVIGVAALFILNFAVWTQVAEKGQYLFIVAISYPLSRALGSIIAVTFKPAKGSGLLYAFSSKASKKVVGVINYVILISLVSIILIWNLQVGLIYVAILLIYYLWFYFMSKSSFGGVTGDLIGFSIVCNEFIAVLIAAICAVKM